jgi:hypothetical protein
MMKIQPVVAPSLESHSVLPWYIVQVVQHHHKVDFSVFHFPGARYKLKSFVTTRNKTLSNLPGPYQTTTVQLLKSKQNIF